MSWKKEFDEKFVKLEENKYLTKLMPCELIDFIEALLKETEERAKLEVLDEILAEIARASRYYCEVTYTEFGISKSNIVHQCLNSIELQQLREKYKGVE